MLFFRSECNKFRVAEEKSERTSQATEILHFSIFSFYKLMIFSLVDIAEENLVLRKQLNQNENVDGDGVEEGDEEDYGEGPSTSSSTSTTTEKREGEGADEAWMDVSASAISFIHFFSC